MIKLGKSSELKFCALIDTGKERKKSVIDIYLIDPPEEIRQEKDKFEEAAKGFVFEFFKTKEDGGLIFSSTSKKLGKGLIIELERFEVLTKMLGDPKPIYSLILKVSHESGNTNRMLRRKNKALEQKNKLLEQEVRELIDLVETLEETNESFRIPFDAIKDLMISFDTKGNVLIVNEASIEWFGQSPKDIIVRKKYRTILGQNVLNAIQKVCASGDALIIDKNIGDRILQITYIPMVNKKSGETEVVMLAQDVTNQKKMEEAQIQSGRNEGVTAMGGTVKHILNSSLTAILGFAQLALSSYEWPRETMVKYLKLIERTTLRMKKEINKIAEQKEYKLEKYVYIPETEDCKEIIQVELDKKSDGIEK